MSREINRFSRPFDLLNQLDWDLFPGARARELLVLLLETFPFNLVMGTIQRFYEQPSLLDDAVPACWAE